MPELENEELEPKVEESEEEELETSEEGGDEGEGKAKGGDPAKALAQERNKRKELSRKLKEVEEQFGKLKPLADEYQQLLPYLPQLLQAAGRGGNGRAPEQSGQPDQEALELAAALKLEDDEGKPDASKARALISYMDKRVGAHIHSGTAGIRRESASVAVNQIRERAYKATDKEGKLFARKEFIDKVFSQVPPEALLNPDNAVAALIMARGLGGAGDASQDEPLHVEGGGGRIKSKPAPLTDLEKSIATLRGKSPQEWQKLSDDPATTGWDLE